MLRVLLGFAVGCSYAPRVSDIPPDGSPPMDRPAADGPATDGPEICPVDFVLLAGAGAGSRYRALSTPQSYALAVAECSALGPNVHLTRVDTQAEVDALVGLVGLDTMPIRVVGSRHINNPTTPTDDTWHDLDDVTPLGFLPWGSGEPTNGSGELCMSIRDELSGNPPPRVAGADDCTTARRFVCECE